MPRRLGLQQGNLPSRRRRRLLEHDVLAGPQRGECGPEVRLGRRADGDGIEILHTRQQSLYIDEVRYSVHARISAGAGHELEARVGGERRNVLIAGDLADPHQAQLQWHAVPREMASHRSMLDAWLYVSTGRPPPRLSY